MVIDKELKVVGRGRDSGCQGAHCFGGGGGSPHFALTPLEPYFVRSNPQI
jgi:hypothetical protein